MESKVIIECDCGAHMLKVVNDVDNGVQEYYLAMFKYGNGKRGFWGRLKIAFNYMRSGEMFNDQLCLNKDEAGKLREFLNATLLQ